MFRVCLFVPDYLKTRIMVDDQSIEVFVQQNEKPAFFPEQFDAYAVELKDAQNKSYGFMHYSIEENHIEILGLEKTDNTARYVGTALIEWILKQSFILGKNGNLELTSDYGSYVFWYPMGFRAQDEEENRALEQLLEQRKLNENPSGRLPQRKETEEELSFTFMYLNNEMKEVLMKKFDIDVNQSDNDYEYSHLRLFKTVSDNVVKEKDESSLTCG